MNNTLKSLHKNNSPQNCKNQAGFTLIELAIVILIGGILVSFMGSALFAFMKKSQVNKTQFNMEKVEEAFEDYFNINGRYPCPASRFLGPGDANYGREVDDTSCSTGNELGTALSGGVRIGAVPTRTLNLPDEFMNDSWQQKLTYAVTGILAEPGNYVANGGRIILQDSATPPNSLVNPAGRAHYVIISHGLTGDGSFPAFDSVNRSTNCPTAANALDRENCDDDRTFISTLIASDVTGTDFFDDYLVFAAETVPVLNIPDDAVMPFNLSACPTGWSEFTDARSRFIIGAAGSTTLTRFEMLSSGNQSTFNFAPGNTGAGDIRAGIPPWIALIYCQKDP